MKIWEAFVKTQESELGSEAVSKWLKTLKVVHFDARNLYLEAKDPFAIHWFEEHVRSKVRKYLVNNNNAPIKVHLALAEAHTSPKKQKKIWKPALDLSPDSLDPHATFDRFIPGEENLLAVQLFRSILDKKECFNPVFLSGPLGSGKTHLLMAATHYLTAQGLSCFYVRAETFTEHLIAAIRNGAMRLFRDLYRNHDVLIVDDIDTIAGRAATQEEFFHMFNALHSADKQMIFAAHNIPSSFSNIEPRLTSRFEWGIVLSLQKLEASSLKGSSSKNASILLEKLLLDEKKILLTPEKIIRSVCEVCGTTSQDILGKSQKQESVVPRQLAIYLCRTRLKMPFQKIGHIFSRDHSTIMTSVKIIQKQIDEQNKEISSHLTEISQKIS
jgi:chromosomal replication initiator protein